MAKAPAGALVKLYIDSFDPIKIGEWIVTTTGRAYQIVELRRQMKGKYRRRWHIKAIVHLSAPEDAVIHKITWYKR